jgi:hypothetical protein
MMPTLVRCSRNRLASEAATSEPNVTIVTCETGTPATVVTPSMASFAGMDRGWEE